MMAMEHPKRPWWKEPMVWLIAGLPATAVVAGFTTYFIAAHEPDSLVRADFRKEGFALVEKTTEADQKAVRLGLRARLSVQEGRLEVALTSRHAGPPPAGLSLTIIHPTQERRDLRLSLVHAQGESYVARLPDLGSGRRLLVLEPDDRTWRIAGQWTAPFSGRLELEVATTNPSTHP